MKLLAAAIAIILASSHALAQQNEIQGAFGYKLLETYKPGPFDKEESEGIGGNGIRHFKVKPPKPAPEFSTYRVGVSKNGRIISIGAYGTPQSGIRAYESLKKELDEIYGPVQQKQIPPKYLGAEYKIKNRMVRIKVNTSNSEGQGMIGIFYCFAPTKAPSPSDSVDSGRRF